MARYGREPSQAAPSEPLSKRIDEGGTAFRRRRRYRSGHEIVLAFSERLGPDDDEAERFEAEPCRLCCSDAFEFEREEADDMGGRTGRERETDLHPAGFAVHPVEDEPQASDAHSV